MLYPGSGERGRSKRDCNVYSEEFAAYCLLLLNLNTTCMRTDVYVIVLQPRYSCPCKHEWCSVLIPLASACDPSTTVCLCSSTSTSTTNYITVFVDVLGMVYTGRKELVYYSPVCSEERCSKTEWSP